MKLSISSMIFCKNCRSIPESKKKKCFILVPDLIFEILYMYFHLCFFLFELPFTKFSWDICLYNNKLMQQYPTFLAPRTDFMEGNSSTDQGVGGWFRGDSSALHLLRTLFLLVLLQFYFRPSGIRFQRLGTTDNELKRLNDE